MNGTELAIAIQSGYEQGFNDGAIEEIEKIKAEISAKQDEFIHSNLLSECNVRYGLNIAEIIIDKHITELKGEQE